MFISIFELLNLGTLKYSSSILGIQLRFLLTIIF